MTYKYMKRCSDSLIVRETDIGNSEIKNFAFLEGNLAVCVKI